MTNKKQLPHGLLFTLFSLDDGVSDLHKAIENRVNQWLHSDFEKLLYCLYRLDIKESKIRELLDSALDSGMLAGQLTQLIIKKSSTLNQSPQSEWLDV